MQPGTRAEELPAPPPKAPYRTWDLEAHSLIPFLPSPPKAGPAKELLSPGVSYVISLS